MWLGVDVYSTLLIVIVLCLTAVFEISLNTILNFFIYWIQVVYLLILHETLFVEIGLTNTHTHTVRKLNNLFVSFWPFFIYFLLNENVHTYSQCWTVWQISWITNSFCCIIIIIIFRIIYNTWILLTLCFIIIKH